jgi:hypothetical protein
VARRAAPFQKRKDVLLKADQLVRRTGTWNIYEANAGYRSDTERDNTHEQQRSSFHVALLFLFKLTGSAAEGWRVLEITRPFRGLIYIKRLLTFLNPYPLSGGF